MVVRGLLENVVAETIIFWYIIKPPNIAAVIIHPLHTDNESG